MMEIGQVWDNLRLNDDHEIAPNFGMIPQKTTALFYRSIFWICKSRISPGPMERSEYYNYISSADMPTNTFQALPTSVTGKKNGNNWKVAPD